MELSEMFPEASSFKLVIAGETKRIRLRKVSLRDHMGCTRIFGSEIAETLEKHGGDIDKISRLVYNQIVPEDTNIFAPVECEAVNEEGKKFTLEMGGCKLLAMLCDSVDAFQEMMDAYSECLFSGMPVVDEKKK